MPTKDQVAWANANVLVGTARTPYARGSLLPEPVTPDESYDRQTLRLIGALRVVEVVYTPEELAEQMRAQGEAGALREQAGQVDPAAPLGQQTEQQAAPGPPTVTGPGGAPVVIGDEDLRAEHEQASQEARQRGEKAARKREQGEGETGGEPAPQGAQPTVAQPEAQAEEPAAEPEPPPGQPRQPRRR